MVCNNNRLGKIIGVGGVGFAIKFLSTHISSYPRYVAAE